MKEVRIIGIGSPFGGDCVGWDAIDAIERSGLLEQFPAGRVKTFRCLQPMSGLLPLLADASAAILVDAMQSGWAPGTIRRFDPDNLAVRSGQMSCHGLGVPESLALGRTLGLLPHTVVVYGIEMPGSDVAPGLPNAALAALLRTIAADLRGLLQRKP